MTPVLHYIFQTEVNDDDIIDLSHHSISPIGKTKIKVQKDESESDGENENMELSFSLLTDKNFKKHFNKNDRLQDQEAVKYSVKNSSRLGGSPTNPSDVSKPSTSSCQDRAHKAPSPDKKNTSSNRSTTSSNRSQTSNKSGGAQRKLGTITVIDSTSGHDETAQERYNRLKGSSSEEVWKNAAAGVSVKGRKKGEVKKKATKIEDSELPDSEDTNVQNVYGVEINTEWYKQQGSHYRKMKDAEVAKKRREKDSNGPLMQIMKEKSDYIKTLTENLVKPPPSSFTNTSSSPTQLWADSLVPQLDRMPQETRDDFMCHVYSLAFKAIAGRWP